MRTCVVVNDTVVEKCANVNKSKDAFCYLCNTDLCNSRGFPI